MSRRRRSISVPGESQFSDSNRRLPRPVSFVDDVPEDDLRPTGPVLGITPWRSAVLPERPAWGPLPPGRRVLRRTLRPPVPVQYFPRSLSWQTVPRDLFMRVPERVKFCVQRKERREVLFAKKRAGFGGSARKRFWRRSASSQYRC